jgi:lipid-A-disaccharide synthase
LKIGLVAGEASGDLLAAGLISALRDRYPDAIFEGVAGPKMIAAGCECWEESETLAVMGLIEPLKVLPKLLKLRRTLIQRWTESPPDVFVGIDSPEFNLGLEKRLRAAGIPTAHYVSPSVWAWRQGRVKKIGESADCVLCLLPFEKRFYEEHDVRAEFVGHPTADRPPAFDTAAEARTALGLDTEGQVVSVLPGSRRGEVACLAEPFAGACAILRDKHPSLRFVTPVASPNLRPMIEAAIEAAGVRDSFTLLDGQSEAAMAAADVVLLASGTAALESALLCRPTVAAYKVVALTAWIIRIFKLFKVDYVTLPNQLTETPLVPELIQWAATPEAIANAVDELLESPDRAAFIRERFATLRTELALDADQRAADVIAGLANAE